MLEPGNRKYVRTTALAANLDVKTYDAGNFFVCTTDGTAVNWGKLWVEYDVDLYVPQLPPQGIPHLAEHLSASSSTTADPLAGTVTKSSGSDTVVSYSGDVFTFLVPGNYMVNLS